MRSYEPVIAFRAIGLDPGVGLESRVTARFDAMLEAGLVEEVKSLAGRMGRSASQAVGYKQLLPAVTGHAELPWARVEAIRATLGLAKRQRTFFRRDPRITWLPWQDEPATAAERVMEALEGAQAWTS
ncbi:MAG: hypothetical protein EHM57_04860 [Actinobacteria bacterium]|nr:MAG: hypothetical protein EHM57_04860 [Actinomycetota bacterium]